MRRVISILIVLGLLLGMILAVTSCPKSEAPGAGGTVTNQPTAPPMQPSETAVPEGAPEAAPDGTQPAAPPEGGEAAPPAEGGEGAPPAPAPPAPAPGGEGGK
jgi:hypothetical protein